MKKVKKKWEQYSQKSLLPAFHDATEANRILKNAYTELSSSHFKPGFGFYKKKVILFAVLSLTNDD